MDDTRKKHTAEQVVNLLRLVKVVSHRPVVAISGRAWNIL